MAEEPEQEQQSPDNLPEPAQHNTADYEKFAQPEKPIRNWTRIFSIFMGFLILLGLGAAAYWYFNIHKPAKSTPTTTSQSVAPQEQTVATKAYASSNLNLSFSYPENWKVVDSNGTSLTVTSPLVSMKDASGKSVQGKITMTIQNSQPSALPGFKSGNGTAVVDSQKITYTKPTQTQRANTYISFVQYSTTTAANGLDAIYVTADNGYTRGQGIPQTDLLQVSPIISVTFTDQEGKALTISATNWDNSNFSDPILNMLKSLSIT